MTKRPHLTKPRSLNLRSKKPTLWITDPWDTLDHPNDTTLRLAQAGLELGVGQYWCDVRSIRLENGKLSLKASAISSMGPDRKAREIQMGTPQEMELLEFSSVHYRVDPPVDLAYLHPLQLLGVGLHDKKSKAELVNPLEVLFGSNEKTEGYRISSKQRLMPSGCISSQWAELEAFGMRSGEVVLKPLYEAQSKGVERLDFRRDEAWARAVLEKATHEFSSPVLLQQYLPGIQQGEVRLWFIDGKLLASIRKMPLKGDFRVNMDAGSRLTPTVLTEQEKQAAKAIGAHLRKRQIRLAAVDLIDGLITDFNFTSPGLITQMETILERNLAGPIVKTLLQRRSN